MNTKLTKLAAAMLVLPLLAGLASAGTNSDNDSVDDWCNAFDLDGARPNPPVGESESCDGEDANGDDEDTYATVLFGNPLLVTCDNNPAGTGKVDETFCTGGAYSFADTASFAGNFGGDYPRASEVTFVNMGNQVRWEFRVCEKVFQNVVPEDFSTVCYDTFGNPDCLGMGSISGNSRTFTATSDNHTIHAVYAFMYIGTPLTCGMGSVGHTDARAVMFDWTYDDELNDNAAQIHDFAVTPAGLLCDATWGTTATGSNTWGYATSWLFFGEDADVFGFFTSDEGYNADASVATHTLTGPAGVDVWAVATAWSVGHEYKYDSAFSDACA